MTEKQQEPKKPSAKSMEHQKAMISRLNKVEGQIRGIKKMIELNTFCDDTINQIEASRSALHSIQIILLESHIKHCMVDHLEQGDILVLDEILKIIKKLTK